MNPRHAARWLVAASLAALCCWAMVRAAHIGWASYQSIEARALLKRWMENPASIDQLAWNRAREGFLTALKWDSENPDYHEGYANLWMVRLSTRQTSPGTLKPYLDMVLPHYLKAAALRPTWPYTHASIATVKQLLGELDADFERAIRQASRYGPWDSPIHERIISVGYRAWASLKEPEREAVRGNVVRAFQYRPKETLALMATLKAAMPSCAELALEIQGACRRAGEAREVSDAPVSQTIKAKP